MIQFLSCEETSDPAEFGGNQDVRYQEFNEVTPDVDRKTISQGLLLFCAVIAPEGALFCCRKADFH